MKLWFSIIITLILQELVTTNAVLLNARQQNYNMLLISLVFIVATTLIIFVGYGLGKWIQTRFKDTRLVAYSEKKVQSFEQVIGSKGSKVALVLLGLVNFNYVNAFLASWLSLSFAEVFLFLLLGDVLWYSIELGIVYGVSSFVDPAYAIYVVLAISLVLSLVVGLVHRKVTHDHETKVA